MKTKLKLASWISAFAFLCGPCNAASLGEEVEQEASTSPGGNTVIGSVSLGEIKMTITEVTVTKSIIFPDSSSYNKSATAKRGTLIVFVRGTATNIGNSQEEFEKPLFVSKDGRAYSESETLFVDNGQEKSIFILLQPDEVFEFATYYIIKPSDIMGGKLRLQHNTIFDGVKSRDMSLPLDTNTKVEDTIRRPGITTSLFD